ncbi:MAG: M18 family aminopeptidase [Oscillospiraceae bacterium]|nr:M18 family aminopeptidase [Oscillospiraceae bacterium]
MDQYSKGLLTFIQEHPSVYHVIEGQRRKLTEAGYAPLSESRQWKLQEGGKYFVTRNDSALIAFRIPRRSFRGFMIMASHSDSPVLKIKENPEITVDGKYTKLNVELYGGALLGPWFDRPLSVAGRVLVRTDSRISSKLLNIPRDLVLIPSLAIHMDRTANEGRALKVQKDMLPLYGLAGDMSFPDLIAAEAGVPAESIVSYDLFVYNRQAPSVWGAAGEFLSSPRLDDLQCVYSSLCGFLESTDADSIPVHVVFDNEEVGSMTKQGAASSFLKDVLERIAEELGLSRGEYREKLAQSFMLSADNAHALHPNYPEKCDPVNRPVLGGGVVLKQSGNQKYATDAVSAAVVRMLAEKAGVRLQVFTNHSDIPGGSTLGNISSQQVAVKTADVGIAQLAMHSPYETCGAADTAELVKLAKMLYSSSLSEKEDGIEIITPRFPIE